MTAQRSGPFSCGDRNHSWIRNNEEGKSRMRDQMPIDLKDSRVFFRKRIPSGESSRENKEGMTRRYAESGIKEKRRWWDPRKTGETRKGTYIDYRVRCLEPQTGRRKGERNQEYQPNLIPVGLRANPSTIQPSFLEPSCCCGIPDFPPVSEKGDDGSACDSGICRKSNLRGHRIAPMWQNCRTMIDSFAGHNQISNSRIWIFNKNQDHIYYLDIGHSMDMYLDMSMSSILNSTTGTHNIFKIQIRMDLETSLLEYLNVL